MKIRIISISHKSPAWLQAGYEEYAKRLPPHCSIELIEIPAEKRTSSSDAKRLSDLEGKKMLAAINSQHHIIALDVKGKAWSTEQLAEQLKSWQQLGRNVDLLIGGADGLTEACLQKANEKWSLSALTFPHLLIRVMLAEQIYRAYTILQGHPYHRG